MDNKKYYYLKLKENFYSRPEIKAIEGMQSGYEYICIIQKMYLRSLERNGKLMLTDTVPYDITLLSSVLGHKQETIRASIEIFNKLGLIEILDDKTIYMLEIQNFIGESSTEADRIRDYRKKIKQEKIEGVQMYDKGTPEIKIELEKELELEKEKDLNVGTYTDNVSDITIDNKNDTKLYNAILQSFESKNGGRLDGASNYGKEGKAIKNIISKAKKLSEDYHLYAQHVVETYYKLVESDDKFWDKHPFLPSRLNSSGIWPMVVKRMKKVRKKHENDKKDIQFFKEVHGCA